MSSSRIELSDHRTNKKDEVDHGTDSIPDLIYSYESDDDDGDLDIVLPSILSTNKKEDENDTDSIPDLIYSSESDDDDVNLVAHSHSSVHKHLGIVNVNLVSHTHSSVLKYYGQKLPGHTHSSVLKYYGQKLPFPSDDYLNDAVVDKLVQGHTHESIDQQFKAMWLTLTHEIEEERVQIDGGSENCDGTLFAIVDELLVRRR
jgi:hypothetical protein